MLRRLLRTRRDCLFSGSCPRAHSGRPRALPCSPGRTAESAWEPPWRPWPWLRRASRERRTAASRATSSAAGPPRSPRTAASRSAAADCLDTPRSEPGLRTRPTIRARTDRSSTLPRMHLTSRACSDHRSGTPPDQPQTAGGTASAAAPPPRLAALPLEEQPWRALHQHTHSLPREPHLGTHRETVSLPHCSAYTIFVQTQRTRVPIRNPSHSAQRS